MYGVAGVCRSGSCSSGGDRAVVLVKSPVSCTQLVTAADYACILAAPHMLLRVRLCVGHVLSPV